MERLHEGRRLWTMGGGGGGSRIRPRWAGMVKLWWPLLLSLLLASVEAQQKESYGGKKKLFPRKSGKYPGRGGKKLDSKTLDNDGGTVVTVLPFYIALHATTATIGTIERNNAWLRKISPDRREIKQLFPSKGNIN